MALGTLTEHVARSAWPTAVVDDAKRWLSSLWSMRCSVRSMAQTSMYRHVRRLFLQARSNRVRGSRTGSSQTS
jgi:hypothetical protein